MTDTLPLAYALIVFGLLLLVVDLIFFTVVLSVVSVIALVVGLAIVYANDTPAGLITTLVVCVAIPLLFTLVTRLAPRLPFGRRFFLTQPSSDETIANMPTNLDLEQLRGRHGITISALRPAGVTDFSGKRVDTLSEGELIEPGQWVRCMDVKAGRVIVRAVDKPPGLDDLDVTQT